MPQIEELKNVLGPVLVKAGLPAETAEKLFDKNSQLSEAEATEISNRVENLTTLQAAEADQNLRNNVIRGTMENIEGKILERIKGLKTRQIDETQLQNIWGRKHLSEKVSGIVDLLDTIDTGSPDLVPKTELEALQHKLEAAENKAKSGSKAWEDIISQKDAAISDLENKYQTAMQAHTEQLQQMEAARVNDDLLSHVRGKIAGEPWFVKATEQEIIKQARGRAQFIRKDGALLARHPENPEVKIFGDNHTAELTPKQLILSIANEMKVLDKKGGGGAPRVPVKTGGSAQREQMRQRNRGAANGNVDSRIERRGNDNRDQFNKMGIA